MLRVNMGNIYFEQQKYPAAIKMYRMALDQVPLTSKSVRNCIMRNIGIAFMRVGQYQVGLHPANVLHSCHPHSLIACKGLHAHQAHSVTHCVNLAMR